MRNEELHWIRTCCQKLNDSIDLISPSVDFIFAGIAASKGNHHRIKRDAAQTDMQLTYQRSQIAMNLIFGAVKPMKNHEDFHLLTMFRTEKMKTFQEQMRFKLGRKKDLSVFALENLPRIDLCHTLVVIGLIEEKDYEIVKPLITKINQILDSPEVFEAVLLSIIAESISYEAAKLFHFGAISMLEKENSGDLVASVRKDIQYLGLLMKVMKIQ